MEAEDLIRRALRDVERVRRRLEESLGALRVRTGETGAGQSLKHGNGRLTDAGVRVLRDMIDKGEADSVTARALSITQSAVHRQRQKYLAESGARKRRGNR
jgi:hypothetical protein